MKRIAKIFIAVALVVFSLLLVACNGSDSPDSIYFTKENTPKQTYVLGQELNFANTLLTIETNGTTETVAMDAEGVTVTGYDKDKLGEQTVTVSYKDKTTTFKVNVIQRITAEGYDTNYFVGDEFNKQNGRIRVADDNAVVTSVNIKEGSVTVSGFDSTTPGAKTVTLSYNGYSTTITVNVLAVESIKLNSPSKKAYQSHETDFSVAGGYFTVTSEGGIIQKTVPVTLDMISGFDPSVATIENSTSTTAIKQIVKIEYLGKVVDFEISIRFSGVSIVKLRAEEMKNVDTNGTISDAIGKNAVDAITEYFDLSSADRALITDEEVNTVAAVASVYAYASFVKETEKYSHTFTLAASESTDSNGNHKEYCGYFTISCEKYEDMLASSKMLNDSESEFNKLASFLHLIEKEFKNLKIGNPSVKVDKYFETLFLADDRTYVADLFKQMVAIFEELMIVDKDWTVEDLKDEDIVKGIESAYSRITTSNFYYLSYPQFYEMINSWRENNDFYEIIHAHFLYNKVYTTDVDNYSSRVWEKIPFPAVIQNLYNLIANGVNQTYQLANGVFDTSNLMLIYYDTLKIVDEIKADEDSIYYDIYMEIDFDRLIDGYLYTGALSGYYAYKNVVGTLLYDKDTLDSIWNTYFAIADLTDENGLINFKDDATVALIKKLFNDFFALEPFERHQIICSLYSNYRNLKIDGHAFDYTEGSSGTFISIFAYFFTGEDIGILPETTYELFQKLMIATEHYGIRYKTLSAASTAIDEYIIMMDEIVALYNALSPTDRSLFNLYAGAAYEANIKLYNAAKAENTPAIEEFPLLGELKASINFYYAIMAEITKDTSAANEKGLYALLFTAYEKANSINNQILASDNAEMLAAYRLYNYVTLNENDGNDTNDYKLTVQCAFNLIMGSARGYSITVTSDDGTKTAYNAIDYYTDGGLAEFIIASYEVLYNNFAGKTNSAEAILAVMAHLRTLDEGALELFYSLNFDAPYYLTVEAFFDAALADDELAAALADALIEVEKNYAGYLLADEAEEGEDAEEGDETTEGEEETDPLTDFINAWNTAAEKKAALGDSNANYDELLKDMYEFYLAIYNELTATAQA